MSDPASLLRARYYEDVPAPPSWNATLDTILAHSSVRHFRPGSLPAETLAVMMAAAQSASSSSNLQLWSVIAIEDPARKARLAALAGGQRHVAQAPLALAWLVDLARLRHLSEEKGVPAEGLDYVEGFLLGVVDAALAAQNAMLALESLGLGCCYIGGFRNKPYDVAAELALPPHVFTLFGMTVGWPDPARPAQVKPRLPQQALLFHEQYRWSRAERDAIAAYEPRLRAFQQEEGMRSADWTAQATGRVQDIPALTGREVLRGALRRFGFELR